jgi:predicted nucleic acid-binding protein
VTVPDASAIIEMLTRSERGLRVESRLLESGSALHAPALLDLEVAQVLRRYEGRGEITAPWGKAAIRLLAALPISRYMHEPLLPRIWELRDNVTAYDAAYLALAEALHAPVVTCDRRLAKVKGVRATLEVID